VSDSLRAGLRAAIVLAVALASTAQAETASDRRACLPSVVRLCPKQALIGDRDGAIRCLFARLSEASAECQAVVRGDAGQAGVLAAAPSRPAPPIVGLPAPTTR